MPGIVYIRHADLKCSNDTALRSPGKGSVMMIEVAPGEVIDHTEQAGPLIAHFTATGRLVLLEILDASEFLSQVIKATLRCEKGEIPLALG